MEKRNHRGTYNRTTLSDIGTGYFPGAEGREFASVGLQRYVWTSFFYHFDGSDIHRYSFLDFFLHFPPDPYGIRVFQLNVGRYDRFIFVIFIGILWDCRDFAVGMKTEYVGRFLMRTLFYRLTSKRKHLPLPKNAVKENGFIFASLTSLFFSFFMLLSSRLFPPQTENLSRHLRKSEIKSPYFPIFALLFSPHFENPQSICDTLIRNINFRSNFSPEFFGLKFVASISIL